MKKSALSVFFILFTSYSFGQMSSNLQQLSQQLEKASSVSEYDVLHAKFMDLTKVNTEKTYREHYYAALTQYKKAELLLAEGKNEAAANTANLALKLINFSVLKSTNDSAENKKGRILQTKIQTLDTKLQN